MNKNELMEEILNKHGEWLEMSEEPSAMLIDILLSMVLKERESKDYYARRINV